MTSLQRHIETLTQASLEIEARSRRAGGSYMRDADAYDGFEEASLKAQQGVVGNGGKKDAPPHGLAIFTSDDGGFEILPMGTAKATIGSKGPRPEHDSAHLGTEYAPCYEQTNEKSFVEAARRSHEHSRSHGSEPVNLAKGAPATDTALVRQRLNSVAYQRRLTADAFDRNSRIAAAMKAESDRLWGEKERIA